MELELVKDKLYEVCEPFDFNKPPFDPIDFSHSITKCAMENSAYSLSANQCGLLYRAFVVVAQPVIVMFNPKIVDMSDDDIYLEEVCASYPKFVLKVKRPEVIRLRYTLPNGQTETAKFQGLTARLIMHEMDHLDGLTWKTAANPYHLEQAKKRFKKVK